ncbi:hypothetical protein ES702_02760 [subsurface metagenome]
MVGSNLNEQGTTQEEIDNLTMALDYDDLNLSLSKMSDNENETTMTRALYKYSDFLLFLSIEASGDVINYGYNNPQYNYNLLFNLILIGAFIPFLVPFFFACIFIGYMIFLLFKFWYKLHKKRLRRKNKR